MNQLSVATWNAEGMFGNNDHKTRRGSSEDALHVVQRLGSDVIVVPEFASERSAVRSATKRALNALGYELAEIPYEENDNDKDYVMMVASRLPIISTSLVRLGGLRNAGRVTLKHESGQHVHVFAIHLDDRAESIRLTQAANLTEAITALVHDGVTIALGDFNAMRARTMPARIARSRLVRKLGKHAPGHMLKSIAHRVSEMARGTTIEYLATHTKLHDLDPQHALTISAKQRGLEWAPAMRLAKIDWILGSAPLRTVRYKVLPDSGSDHRPVYAELEWK